jgi:hypothetical protein
MPRASRTSLVIKGIKHAGMADQAIGGLGSGGCAGNALPSLHRRKTAIFRITFHITFALPGNVEKHYKSRKINPCISMR